MMRVEIQGEGPFDYDGDPTICPLCQHAITPDRVSHNVIRLRGKTPSLQLIYRCPNSHCQQAFVATYFPSFGGQYTLRSVAPIVPRASAVDPLVAAMSRDYVVLLTQSAHAEQYGLDQIAGTGYRRALEYLVKDFAIMKATDNMERIRAMTVAGVIGEYVSDLNVKECARRAAWLGNDESHYLRKWEDKEVNDLKALLRLTETWILNVLQTEQYLKDMPPPDKPAM
jgi:hypothetical protein